MCSFANTTSAIPQTQKTATKRNKLIKHFINETSVTRRGHTHSLRHLLEIASLCYLGMCKQIFFLLDDCDCRIFEKYVGYLTMY